MKLKKCLLVIVLAIIAIVLLQAKVRAADYVDTPTIPEENTGNVSEYVDSKYDYFLTESNKVLSKTELSDAENSNEIIVACIEGEYTGSIEMLHDEHYNEAIKLNNFNATTLDCINKDVLDINGINSISNLGSIGDEPIDLFYVYGDGILEFRGIMCTAFENNGISDDFSGDTSKLTTFTIYLGTYISEIKNAPENYGRIIRIYGLEDLETYLSYGAEYVYCYTLGDNIIPANAFEELKKYPNTAFHIDSYRSNTVITFNGGDIKNTVDFNAAVRYSESPFDNMVDTNMEGAIYIDFEHSGTVPGSIIITVDWSTSKFEMGDKLKCYYYNETTELYEEVEDAEMISPHELKLNIDHCSKFVVTDTQLPSKFIEGDNNEDIDEKWFCETEVKSLVWTEEDINSVLTAIEETRNNTSEKELYVHVPSGSKVPAKIFEESDGIEITIIAEDGIYAHFKGGNYKAIDYVAGGVISAKALGEMVNVGENNIVYISLKHEGQLPATCNFSYFKGRTDVITALRPCDIETKLYYFNDDEQKYELCGSGLMASFADDYCEFELEHCSSYVMSEESLPEEFLVSSKTEEQKPTENNKEEQQQETPKKEENKKDETTAPGKIPYAGGTTVIILSVAIMVVIGTIAYIKNRELKGI